MKGAALSFASGGSNEAVRRGLFIAGNVAAGAALVLLMLDPTRNLTFIVGLLAVAVIFAWVLPRVLGPKE